VIPVEISTSRSFTMIWIVIRPRSEFNGLDCT